MSSASTRSQIVGSMAQSSDDEEENPVNLLNEWLGELQILTDGLETAPGGRETEAMETSKPLCTEIATPRIDSYRFSMANLEDSQEVDLDAILMELCALETKCDEEIKRNSLPISLVNPKPPHREGPPVPSSIHTQMHHNVPPMTPLQRTDSPDNDSAFSDTVSMLSSESSTSSGASAVNKCSGLPPNLYHKDAVFLAKQEKIRLALEKMKKASIKKLFIKAFTVDGSSKSLLVDEKMTCGYVTRLLADKNHVAMDPKWAIVEYLNDLYMERIFEDHEILVDNLMLWARDSKNKIYFVERPEKVALFHTPEKYLINEVKEHQNDYDEHSRSVMIDEFFSQSPSNGINSSSDRLSLTQHPTPQLEGPLYLKNDAKKGWKKYHFVLKPSGIYYYPKEKSKSKEMTCLANFDMNEVYVGVNWKKKYKAPTDFCFALKHPRLQQPKGLKYIKFLCAEDGETLDKWVVSLRIAKHGKHLLDNYHTLADDLAQEDLDQLAYARSCSVISISHNNSVPMRHVPVDSPVNDESKNIYSGGSIASSSDLGSTRLSCTSSSSSSGCMSDGGNSVSEGNAFDSEFSTGTIKRKPSMKPNIPLTTMTRQLKEMADSNSCGTYTNGSNDYGSVTSTYTNTGTLTRRSSRRKSTQSNNTDDSSNSGTLKRYKVKTSQGSIDSMSSSQSSNNSNSLRDGNYGVNNSMSSGNQSPVYSITSHTKNGIHQQAEAEYETIPQTGIIMGYITQQQTAIPPNFERHYSQESQTGLVSNKYNDYATKSQLNIELNDEILQNLPLPSPPKFTSEELGYEFNPMFSSTLSLESLPPPPPESQPLSCNNLSESQLSLLSLPPPPSMSDLNASFGESVSSLGSDDLKIGMNFKATLNNIVEQVSYRNTLTNSEYRGSKPKIDTNSNTSPKIINSLQTNYVDTNYSRGKEEIYGKNQPNSKPDETEIDSKPVLRRKQVSFTETPILLPKRNTNTSLCESDTSSSSSKPLPPKRNETTKLTSPKKLSDSSSNPPKNFLTDLKRVMAKKWQVSQKCKLEPSKSPYEVLGFRENPIQQEDYKETNVSNWVQEHYGHINVPQPPNLYENIISKDEKVKEYGSSLYATAGSCSVRPAENMIPVSKKRPPPPIPKRSENTQLSGAPLQKSH